MSGHAHPRNLILAAALALTIIFSIKALAVEDPPPPHAPTDPATELRHALWGKKGLKLYCCVMRADKPQRRTNDGMSIDKDLIYVDFPANHAREIMETLAYFSHDRIEWDPAAPNDIFEVQFFHHPDPPAEASPRLFFQSFAQAAGLEAREESPERDVWVARGTNLQLPPGAGHMHVIPRNKATEFEAQSVTTSQFLESLGQGTKQIIIDELNLPGCFNVTWKVEPDFEKLRQDIEKRYGITLTRERRKVPVLHIGLPQK